jgi:hypothetical protein
MSCFDSETMFVVGLKPFLEFYKTSESGLN